MPTERLYLRWDWHFRFLLHHIWAGITDSLRRKISSCNISHTHCNYILRTRTLCRRFIIILCHYIFITENGSLLFTVVLKVSLGMRSSKRVQKADATWHGYTACFVTRRTGKYCDTRIKLYAFNTQVFWTNEIWLWAGLTSATLQKS